MSMFIYKGQLMYAKISLKEIDIINIINMIMNII